MVRRSIKYWVILFSLITWFSTKGAGGDVFLTGLHTNNAIASDQTICSGEIPLPLTGTLPTGGAGIYTYQWQFSTDNISYSPAPGGNNQQNYTIPTGLFQDTYYRRLVSSTGCPADTSTSGTVLIRVQSAPCSERMLGISSNGDEFGHDVVVDSVNQWVYTVGSFGEASLFTGIISSDLNNGGGNGNMDGYLVKRDYNGNQLWVVNMGGAGDDETMALTLAPDGNIYVTGYFDDVIRFKSASGGFSTLSPMNQEDMFVAAYNPAGNLQFSAFGGGANSDLGMGITSNSSGVYVTGVYEDAASFGTLNTEATFNNRINGFIVKYGFLGPPQLLLEMKTASNDQQNNTPLRDAAYDIASDEGNIYAVGYMGGNDMRFVDSSGTLVPTASLTNTSNTPNTFICSFDTAGDFNWAVDVDDPSGNKRGFGIDVDCDGVYVATNIHNNGLFPSGTVINSLSHDNPVLMKLDLNTGIDQWLAVLGTNNPVNHIDLLHDVKADGYGNLYVAGQYGWSDFMTPDTILTGASGLDAYVARYSNTGNFDWARSLNGNSDDVVHAVAVSGRNRLFITGAFENELRLAPDTINGPNNWNVLWGNMRVEPGGVGTQNCCSVLPVAGTLSSSIDSLCFGQSVNLNLSGSSGTVEWESSTDGGINWNTIPLQTSPSITDSPTQTTEYRAILTGFSPLCVPDTSNVVSVRVDSIPTPSNAGPDQFICGDTFAVFAGNSLAIGTGLWALEAGSGTASMPNNPTSPVSGLSIGTNTFIWKVSSGACPTSSDTVSLVVQAAPVVKLGADTIICAGDSLTLFADPGSLYPGAGFLWSTGDTTTTLTVSIADTYFVSVDTAGCIGADTIAIDLTPQPVASLPGDTMICAGDSLLIDADPNGLNTGASFSWSTGDTLDSVIVNTAGTFFVDISYGGCPPESDTMEVLLIPVPMIDLGEDTTICGGDSILLDADPGGLYPGATYQWSTGANSSTLTAMTTNTYSVIVDTAGCIGRDTINVSVTPQPVAVLPGDTMACDGDSIHIDADPIGLNFGATFAWSTGDSLDKLNVYASGTYYVDIFFPGCPPESDTIEVEIIPVPVVDLGSDTTICIGDSILLNADPGGLYPGAGFQWSTGDVTNTITVLNPDTYFVAVDTAGCIGYDTIQIDFTSIPGAVLPGDTSICSGDSIILDGDPTGLNTGAFFSWSTGDSSTTIVVGPGQYYLDISYGGCPQTSDSIEIAAIPEPVVTLGNDTIVCTGDSIVLNADPGGNYPGANYSWSGGSTTQVQTVGTGNWSVVLTDVNGCSGTDTISVTSVSYNLTFQGLDSVYCVAAPTAQLTANPSGGSFSGPGINGGVFDPALAGIGNHTITYSYVDTNGCVFSVQGSTSVGLGVVADAGPDREVYFADQANLEGNSPLPGFGVWGIVSSSGNISSSTDPSATVSGLDNGPNTFSWTIFDNGCQSSDEVTLTLIPFVPERIFTPNADGYNDLFVIPGLEDHPGSSMEIFTRWGERIFVSDDYQNDWQGTNPSGQPLQDDTYFYVLTLNTGEVIKGYIELKR